MEEKVARVSAEVGVGVGVLSITLFNYFYVLCMLINVGSTERELSEL